MIGTLGTVVFEASSESIRTFNGLSITRTARFATHELYNQRPVVEYLGEALETATLTVRFDVSAGLNPRSELAGLKAILDSGQPNDLIIGDANMGSFVLESITETHRVIDGTGMLLVADVSMNLLGV
jgi:phage protein U